MDWLQLTSGEVSIAEYFMLLVCMCGLVLNILFLLMLLKFGDKNPLNSSFFCLCMHLTVADTIMLVFSNVFFKFPIYGWFSVDFFLDHRNGILPKLPVVGLWYFGHAQAFGIVGLALNRFTAAWKPIQHWEKYWTARHTNTALVLQWALPLLVVFPLVFADFTAEANNFTHGVLFVPEDIEFHKAYFIFTAVFDGIVINAFVSTLYVLIFWKVNSRTGTHAVGSPSIRIPNPQVALRLATSGFLIFLCYLALGVFNILTASAPEDNPWQYRDIWFIANDILCTSNAPILLLLNKPVREYFWALFGAERPERKRSSHSYKQPLGKHAEMLIGGVTL